MKVGYGNFAYFGQQYTCECDDGLLYSQCHCTMMIHAKQFKGNDM